ncbi:hypothetical protein DESC_520027 [Desulfosarcina cetonica]|nr:hypothetical protein DESC_520027 [Desulfosarcina cetonica]
MAAGSDENVRTLCRHRAITLHNGLRLMLEQVVDILRIEASQPEGTASMIEPDRTVVLDPLPEKAIEIVHHSTSIR